MADVEGREGGRGRVGGGVRVKTRVGMRFTICAMLLWLIYFKWK